MCRTNHKHTHEAPIAQWAKRWPAELVVPGLIPLKNEGGNPFNYERGFHRLEPFTITSHPHHYRPDMTDILLKSGKER